LITVETKAAAAAAISPVTNVARWSGNPKRPLPSRFLSSVLVQIKLLWQKTEQCSVLLFRGAPVNKRWKTGE
jgi:hypothetical protein